MILCDERKVDGMTGKLSISLPDDVAKVLDDVDNASAYIAEAIVMRRERDTVAAMLKRHGHVVTAEGVAAWRERLAEMDRRKAARRAEVEK